MKITLFKIKVFTYLCFVVALVCTAHGQDPTPPPGATQTAPAPAATAPAPTVPVATPPVTSTAVTPVVTATAAPVTTIAPAVAPSASPDTEEDFDRAIERKIRKHFTVDFDGGHSGHNSDDVPWIALPIVLIVFLTIFGLPVAIVGTILYFSFSKSRAMHKTVRMMVEKGQPVPEALLNPPPVIRQRSDLRRGIVLLMIGAGLMVFFGAVNDWEGGVWSLGIIPFLIGLGYLLVWRLDVRREDTSPKV
ncbi:MAG TPA: DUF6249 domain-containing protein [Chthoniobacterales bacterium]|jgi:hypothetical protein|nr:DUF6249 domain-containing protein [Chthoniobacterales bacterium]